ncbi:hypothetical protein BH10CYA1_BH10CYA1_02910 [soil metagenome]
MNSLNLKLAHKGLILVLVPLIFELIFLFILTVMVNKAENEAKVQITSKQIMKRASEVEKLFRESARQLGSYSLTGSRNFLDQYLSSVESLKQKQAAFTEFGGASSLQQGVLKDLQSQSTGGISLLDQASKIVQQSPESALHLRSDALYADILRLPNQLEIATDRLDTSILTSDLALQNSSHQFKMLLVAGVVLNVLMTVGLAFVISKEIVARVLTIRENSLRLASGQDLQNPVKGSDEIAELDRAFHRMAASLEEATRKERAIVDNAVDVICSVNGDCKFTRVSPACLEAWGFTPEELLGKRLVDVIADDCIEIALQSFKHCMDTGETLSLETRINHKNGTVRHASWSGSWSRPDKTTFCVVHDSTESKRIEQLKREFVAMVSHDLRAPLTSVQCFLEVLSEGVFADDHDAVMKKARLSNTEISRLVQMVNSLLDVEKMESGKMDVLIAPVPIERILERSINSVAALAEHKKVQINPNGGEDIIATADEDLIVQIMINFLSNAIKFSPAGSEITVSASQSSKTTKISVTDKGRGVPPDFKDKIFDRFQQVELADSRFRGGTGLGLAVCKAIAEAHEGEIGVDSIEGQGSTFWIKLPRAQPL